MRRPLSKELLIPTLLLAGLWLTLSSVTTVYITWLDRSHQRIIDDNVSSMRVAGEIQSLLWVLQSRFTDSMASIAMDESAADISEDITRFRSAIVAAESSSTTIDERNEVVELRRAAARYLGLLTAQLRGELADSRDLEDLPTVTRRLALDISGRCNRLSEINQTIINEDTAKRRSWGTYIGGSRIVWSILGPVVGTWLGFRVASRVRRRLAEISVRLDSSNGEIGRLCVDERDADLDGLDEQVTAITRRLEQAFDELRSARQEIIRSERLASVGQLAAGVAHELRNPLTGVKLLVQTVARRYTNDEQTTKSLGVVREEIARMEQTIQGLLDFARPPTQKRILHDVRTTIARAVHLTEGRATHDHIQIVQDLSDGPCWVDADPEQLHQVLVNLILNGMDAMPNGGQLMIVAHEDASSPLSLKPAASCVITVSDNGHGIGDQVMCRLFEPFVTTKERGTGLGLAISRRIIEQHGGTLTAANSVEGGAAFSIHLPCASQLEPHEGRSTLIGDDLVPRSDHVQNACRG